MKNLKFCSLGLAVILSLFYAYAYAPGLSVFDDTEKLKQGYGDLRMIAAFFRAILEKMAALDFAHLYEVRCFYPLPNMALSSENYLSAVLWTWPFYIITGNAYFCNNLALNASGFLSFWAIWLLARELGASRWAAIFAGMIFAFSEYHYGVYAYLQLTAYYWTPFCLYFLHRYFRDFKKRYLLGAAFCYASQALACSYYFAFSTVFVLPLFIWMSSRHQLWKTKKFYGDLAVPVLLTVVIFVLNFLPILEVHKNLGIVRDMDEQLRYGASLENYLRAPRSWIWQDVSSAILPKLKLDKESLEGSYAMPRLIAMVLSFWGLLLLYRLWKKEGAELKEQKSATPPDLKKNKAKALARNKGTTSPSSFEPLLQTTPSSSPDLITGSRTESSKNLNVGTAIELKEQKRYISTKNPWKQKIHQAFVISLILYVLAWILDETLLELLLSGVDSFRWSVQDHPETRALFYPHAWVGAVVLVLGLAKIWLSDFFCWLKSTHIFWCYYLFVTLVALLVSMGPVIKVLDIGLALNPLELPLYYFFPGYQGIRAICRACVFVPLGLGVLASLGFDLMLKDFRDKGSKKAGWITAIFLGLFLLAETFPAAGFAWPKDPEPKELDPAYNWLSKQAKDGVLLELPLKGGSPEAAPFVVSWAHHLKVINGWSSFSWRGLEKLEFFSNSVPSYAYGAIASFGPRYILVHAQNGVFPPYAKEKIGQHLLVASFNNSKIYENNEAELQLLPESGIEKNFVFVAKRLDDKRVQLALVYQNPEKFYLSIKKREIKGFLKMQDGSENDFYFSVRPTLWHHGLIPIKDQQGKQMLHPLSVIEEHVLVFEKGQNPKSIRLESLELPINWL